MNFRKTALSGLLFSCLTALLIQPDAEASLNNRKIGLDPGHGAGGNPGVVIAEGTWVLDAAFRARTHLQNHGATVVMTRTTGADPSLQIRYNLLNSNNVDVAVSLHSNAASSTAVGIETYYCSLSHSSNSQRLADRLRIRALNMVHNRNRGTKECLQAGRGFHFGMIRYTNMPSSLPEYYFHTNPWENENIHNTTTGRENVARSLYAGVCDYYNVTPNFGPPLKSTKFTANDWVKVVDAESLNLRSGPTTSSTIIKALPRDTIAQVISHPDNGIHATNNHWWYVEVYPDGTRGWLAEYYLEATSSPFPTYTLVTQTSGSGSVSRSPDASSYREGTQVVLTAHPDENYHFSHWSGSQTGSANPVTITMNGTKTVRAHFVENTKYADEIVDNRSPGFSASPNWDTASWADDKYLEDYHFRNVEPVSDPATWTLDIPHAGTYLIYAWWPAFNNRSEQAPYIINHKNGATTVRANQRENGGRWNLLGSYNFEAGETTIQLSCWTTNAGNDIVVADGIRFVTYDPPPPLPKYVLTTTTSGPGTILRDPDAISYDEGTKVTLTATPEAGTEFINWSGNESGNENPLTITMTSDASVTAHFGFSYNSWKNIAFTEEERADADFVPPLADPSRHGIPNLLKYAFGLDVHNPDFNDLPSVNAEEDRLTFHYQRLIGPSDIEYVIETSSDLITWTSETELFVETETTPTPDGRTERVTLQSSAGFTESNPRIFVRVSIHEQ